MEHETNGNGAVYVSFGPRDSEVLPLGWASDLLTKFKERQPALFGAYLAEVATGVRPKAARE